MALYDVYAFLGEVEILMKCRGNGSVVINFEIVGDDAPLDFTHAAECAGDAQYYVKLLRNISVWISTAVQLQSRITIECTFWYLIGLNFV